MEGAWRPSEMLDWRGNCQACHPVLLMVRYLTNNLSAEHRIGTALLMPGLLCVDLYISIGAASSCSHLDVVLCLENLVDGNFCRLSSTGEPPNLEGSCTATKAGCCTLGVRDSSVVEASRSQCCKSVCEQQLTRLAERPIPVLPWGSVIRAGFRKSLSILGRYSSQNNKNPLNCRPPGSPVIKGYDWNRRGEDYTNTLLKGKPFSCHDRMSITRVNLLSTLAKTPWPLMCYATAEGLNEASTRAVLVPFRNSSSSHWTQEKANAQSQQHAAVDRYPDCPESVSHNINR